MGDGLAIEPTDGKVVAPVDGEVVVTFPTKHAVGLKTASGMELLIHVGLRKPFTWMVKGLICMLSKGIRLRLEICC